MYLSTSCCAPPWVLWHFTWPIDNAANSKANIEATKLSLFSFRCCLLFCFDYFAMSLFAQHSSHGVSSAGQDCRVLPLQGLLQAQAPLYPPPLERLLSSLGLGQRAHKQTLCWLSICPLSVCRMPHATSHVAICHLAEHCLVVAQLHLQCCLLRPAIVSLQSASLPPTASLPFPLTHTHTHCQFCCDH